MVDSGSLQRPATSIAPAAGDSWYLDPLVARQKADANRSCVDRWAGKRREGRILKTDLFEEANGNDHVLGSLAQGNGKTFGVDMVASTVARAGVRFGPPRANIAVADVRELPFRPGSFDLIFSTSTLDHFEEAGQIEAAIEQLAAALAPGGRLIVTLDNPLNPLYWPLRFWSKRVGPFSLGRTLSQRRMVRLAESLGLEVVATDYLIHNPRLVSTLLFLGLRRLLGRAADGPVALLMRIFSWGDRLPTRAFTGAFSAVCAERRTGQDRTSRIIDS